MLNCTIGIMGNSYSNKWMPLTGVYIATATFICAIAILKDLVDGYRTKQYWIPSCYSSLNSASLTILGAATKLSMDLSTKMPRHIDQLVKLGTSAFMCIALASVHHSLVKLKRDEQLSNTVALSILFFSSITGFCIQLRTGVIYTFKTEHIVLLAMMSALLLFCISSVLLLSFYKWLYQTDYQQEGWSTRKEFNDMEGNKHQTENLRKYLERFSMLAHSCCPHFLLGRVPFAIFPIICGLVAAIVFLVTQITSIIHGDKFFGPKSDCSISSYDWSILWIFVSQTVAIGVGSIVLCTRGWYVVKLYLKAIQSPIWERNPPKMFWMKVDLLGALLRYDFDYIDYSQHKSHLYKLMIPYSLFRIFYCLILHVIQSTLYSIFQNFCQCITCILPHAKPLPTQTSDLPSELKEISRQYICPYPFEDRVASAKSVMESIIDVTQRYMATKERNTEYLKELLRENLSPDFRGVSSFDSKRDASSLDRQRSPPYCWSLPVVTLTNIAIALPNVNRDSIDKLRKGVNEGLVFVKLIEDKFNNLPDLNGVRRAAYREWTEDFGSRFRNRVKSTCPNKSPIEILDSFVASAEDFKKGDPMVQVASHCLYKLCKTILLEHRNETQDDEVSVLVENINEDIEPTEDDGERILKRLCTTIADIIGACLTNLKQYILMECSNISSIETSRESTSRILKFFGDTKQIMKIIETRNIPRLSWEKMVFIEEWRQDQGITGPSSGHSFS